MPVAYGGGLPEIAARIEVGQINVSSTVAFEFAEDTNRIALELKPAWNAQAVFYGHDENVVVASGFGLGGTDSALLTTSAGVFLIAQTGTQRVQYTKYLRS